MKIKLNLPVSKIPTLIGVNPYGDIKPIVLEYWKKAFPQDYFEYIVNLVEQDVIENPLIRDEDMVKHQSQKYDLDLSDHLKSCRTAKNTHELNSNKKKLKEHINSQSHMSTDDKKLLNESLDKLTRTNYGQHHENSAIELYSEEHSTEVVCQQKFMKKKIAESDTFDWYITGKIDGISTAGKLVEIKNRVHKLFNEARTYERMQVQIYLHTFKLKSGDLVECIKTSNGCQLNTITIEYNKKDWELVKHRLQKFIEFFYMFLQSSRLKYFFVTEPNEIINHYYKNLLFSP